MMPEGKGNGDVGPPSNAQSGPPSELPNLSNRVLWGEVVAVLAIGVLPHLSSALLALYQPPRKLPYWLDSFDYIVRSSCVIASVLYLIYRTGESFANFGLRRPRWIDLLLAVCLLVCSGWLWTVQCCVFPPHSSYSEAFGSPPRQATDYILMVIKYAVNVFAEELVTRAYLITRFEFLLRSKPKAVVAAAMLFASYHVYYGVSFLGYFFALGIVFGGLFLLTRRIWPVAIGHFLIDIRAELAIPD